MLPQTNLASRAVYALHPAKPSIKLSNPNARQPGPPTRRPHRCAFSVPGTRRCPRLGLRVPPPGPWRHNPRRACVTPRALGPARQRAPRPHAQVLGRDRGTDIQRDGPEPGLQLADVEAVAAAGIPEAARKIEQRAAPRL